jgi:integrase
MQATNTRRERGDGSLTLRGNAKGGETWICFWRQNGRGVMRSLGPKRSAAQPRGLTKPQAEAAFKKLREDTDPRPARAQRRTLAEVGAELIRAKRAAGRKPATIEAYDSGLRMHIVPFFGVQDVDKINREDVRRFDAELEAKGLAPKSRANTLGALHSLIEFALSEGWATGENPVKRVPKPVKLHVDADLHFLDLEEIEALLRAVPSDALGRVERVMYLTAAMTGMRQGELLGLRWRDVDWPAGRVRIRRNFVRGEFGTPKSKRSSRAVPLASRVAAELARLFQDSPSQGDDDLVFAHPKTGKPIDRSRLLKRFKAALRRAEVREVRFHDLRHTFGTRMAAQGVPMRTLQEWMGHRDFPTTLIYADFAPSERRETAWVEEAFALDPTHLPGDLPQTSAGARLQPPPS